MQFSKRVQSLDQEIFAALNQRRKELEQQGRKLYDLSIGTPDFPVPQYVKDALCQAADDADNWKYALQDTPALQQAVCSYYDRRFGVKIDSSMIQSCQGSQEGLGHIGMVLCNAGDTVLLPTPCYPAFISGARMAEAEPWYYPMTKENGFLPDVASIPPQVAQKAKYMVVSLPSNPTGSVGNGEVYRKIIDFARRYDIVIIHDNAYSDIVFDGLQGDSFLRYEGAADVGVEFFSLSKSYNVTGARISFCVGNPEIIAAFRKLRSQFDLGMFLPIQAAAVAALQGPREMVEAQRQAYQARRDALCEGLQAIGWPVPKNHGSMFVWAPIPASYDDSMTFARDLMEKAGVIGTPGSSFGPLGVGYIRFALVLPPAKLKEAVRAVEKSGLL